MRSYIYSTFFLQVISLTHELEELQDKIAEFEKVKKNQQVIFSLKTLLSFTSSQSYFAN